MNIKTDNIDNIKALMANVLDGHNGENLYAYLSKFNHLNIGYVASAVSAREAVPAIMRKNGLIITYYINEKPTTEQYVGDKNTAGTDAWIDDNNWQFVNGIGHVDTNSITLNQLSQEVLDLIGKNKKVNIVNYPDGEDLTQVDVCGGNSKNEVNVLKFADKEYNPANFSGLGRVYLRKNIVDVEQPDGSILHKNILTQDMINKEHTFYIIRDDFDLDGKTINIQNRNIVFAGGSINNGTLNCSNTVVQQFKGTANIIGDYIDNNFVYTDNEDIIKDSNRTLKFADKKYNPEKFSGLGRVYLRKNIVDGQNILTQDMVNLPNTIYVIKYDYIVNGYITLKENSYFEYQGGSITINNNRELNSSENSIIDTRIYNPFFRDYRYKNNDIIVNKKTEVHKTDNSERIITQQTDIIANKPLIKKDINTYIQGYYTTRLFGKDRFTGDIKYNESTLYKTIYASEFIKNADNTYNVINFNRGQKINFNAVYNKIKNTFINSATVHYTIIVDFKGIYITDTIELNSQFSLISPDTCIIYLGDNFNDSDNRKNIFEANGNNNFQNSVIDGFNVVLDDNKYYNYFLKLNGNGWKFDLKNIDVCYGLTEDNDKNNNFNGILRVHTEVYSTEELSTNAYTDFLYLYNIRGNIRNNYDIILGSGDCTLIKNCHNIKVFCLGGQKEFKECMQTQIFAILSTINIDNNHNEKGRYSFYKSNISFNSCQIGNAIGENYATITINDESLIDDAKNIFNFNSDSLFFNQIKLNILSNITLNNVIFSFNDISEYNGFKTNLYDIEVKNYNDNVNIKANNCYHTAGWLNYNKISNIYSNVFISKQTIKDIYTEYKSPNIYQGDAYSNDNFKNWKTKNDIIAYIRTLPNANYIVKIKNIISLYDIDRLIGIKKDFNTSFHCNYKNYAIAQFIAKKGNYAINLSIDDEDKYIIYELLTDNYNEGYDTISKHMFYGKTYNDENISCNECSKIDIISDTNIRAYLTELPKYGTWNENDECVVDEINYIYYKNNWIKGSAAGYIEEGTNLDGAEVTNVKTLEPTEEANATATIVDNKVKFTFAIPRGRDGLNGKNGKDAVLPNYSIYRYCKSDTKPTAPTGTSQSPAGWTDIPNDVGNWWQCVGEVNGATGTVTQWGEVLPLNGRDGTAQDGRYTEMRFAVNTNRGQYPTIDRSVRTPSDWTLAAPSVNQGQYLWMTTAIINPNDTLYTNWNIPVCISGPQGDTGATGPAGNPGSPGSQGATGIPGISMLAKYSLGDADNPGSIRDAEDFWSDSESHRVENSEKLGMWKDTVPEFNSTTDILYCTQGKKIYTDNNNYYIEWCKPFQLSGINGIDGSDGKGSKGQIIYPAGIYNLNATYVTTDKIAPYVLDTTDGNYYVLNAIMSWKGTEHDNLTPSQDYAINSGKYWIKFDGFNAIFAKIGIIANGLIGSAVFNGDWMFSQQGINQSGSLSTEYQLFNPNSPYSSDNQFRPNIAINFKTGEVYMAHGNFYCDANGNVTIKGISAQGGVFTNSTENVTLPEVPDNTSVVLRYTFANITRLEVTKHITLGNSLDKIIQSKYDSSKKVNYAKVDTSDTNLTLPYGYGYVEFIGIRANNQTIWYVTIFNFGMELGTTNNINPAYVLTPYINDTYVVTANT